MIFNKMPILFDVRFIVSMHICLASLAYSIDPIPISGDISTVAFDSPQKLYRALSDIEIPQNKIVRIPAGTILLFESEVTFYINGQCAVEGTDSNPVIFSSINDSSYTTASAAPPSPFDWNGIVVSQTARNVVLQNARIKYAQHPLESNCPDIVVKCIYRMKTSDDYFTLNGKQLKAESGKPFYYPPPLPAPTDKVILPPPPQPMAVSQPDKEASWWKQKNFRWTLAGIGTAAVLSAGGCLIGYYVNDARFDREYKKSNIPDADRSQFPAMQDAAKKASQAKKNREYCKQAGIVSGSIGALLFAGLGLTFYF